MEILVFTSPSCAPCKQLKPILLKYQEAHKFKMRFIEPSASTQADFIVYNVRAVPTVVAINDDGDEIGSFSGIRTADQVLNTLRLWKAAP